MQQAVPPEEIERRLGAFQALLRAEGIDGALVVQAVDLYYLAGTVQAAHLVVPASGEPSLHVRRTLARARAESPLERIEPLRSLRGLPEALAAGGLRGGRLGLELDVVPAALYFDYRRRLPEFELVDCSALVRRLRARKSAWELARVREASAMVSRVVEWVPAVAREGMREIELAAELERLFRREGHQGIVRFRAFNQEMMIGSVVAGPSGAVPGGSDTPIVGSGPNVAIAQGASSRPIGRGEPIVVDVVGTSEGYLADITRTFSIGPLAAPLREAYDVAHGILHEAIGEARPGVPWSRLYERASELAGGRDGFMGAGDEAVAFVGHGFGLEIDEPPFLARGLDEPFEEGMVFAFEPKFVFPGVGAVGVENNYALTAAGVELLTQAPDELVEF